MTYITSHERIGMQKGREEFREEFKQEYQKILVSLLENKFHEVPSKYKDIIYKVDFTLLITLINGAIVANTIEEVFNSDLLEKEIP